MARTKCHHTNCKRFGSHGRILLRVWNRLGLRILVGLGDPESGESLAT